MLFLIYLWRSRHAERFKCLNKNPTRENLDSKVRESSLSFRLFIYYLFSKIKISNDPWIAPYICYVYFSKLRFFYHYQWSFVIHVGSGMLTSKTGSEPCHTRWQHTVIPDLNSLCWWQGTVSISEQCLVLLVRSTLMIDTPSGIQFPNWDMKWEDPKPLWTTVVGLTRNCPGCPLRITRKLYYHNYWA